MFENADDVIKEMNSFINDGYQYENDSESTKKVIENIAWYISALPYANDELEPTDETNTLDKIKYEIKEEMVENIQTDLIATLCNIVYSLEDEIASEE